MGALTQTDVNAIINNSGKRRGAAQHQANPCKKLRLDETASASTNFPQRPLSPPSLSSSGSKGFVNAVHINSESDDDHAAAASVIRARRASSSAHKLGAAQHRRRKSFAVPEGDRQARQACFDYLVTAIDEVWAQYCVCTSMAENDRYNELNPLNVDQLPSSPVSLCGEEDEGYFSDEAQTSPSCPGTPGVRRYSRAQEESEKQPESMRLLNLKKRLMNAKYFLSDLVEAMDPVSSAEFWSKFDVIKYELIGTLEENGDDDDVVESLCDELENGRYYNSRY